MNTGGSSGVLCLFAKEPRPAAVKTRLSPVLGGHEAATLARAMLRDVWQALRATGHHVVLAWSGRPGAALDDPYLALHPDELWDQGEGDLGERMERTLARALRCAPWAVALGSDMPSLPSLPLVQAISILEAGGDAVFGPAEDGGFYLLGLRRLPEGALRDLPWSCSSTYRASRDRLEGLGLRCSEVPPWFDVDRPDDLARLRGWLLGGRLSMPHTAHALGLSSAIELPSRPEGGG